MNKFSLDGIWSLSWNDTKTISMEEAIELQKSGNTIPCPVPGGVHMALIDAKIIKEPLEATNSKDCRWIEDKEWWYTKEFQIDSSFIKDKTVICFEGLDLTADIWLNGDYIGNHNNAFVAVEFDISNKIKPGKNSITVRIDDGLYGVKEKPIDFMNFSWNTEQVYRAWIRKPQFVYGWDWTIWLPTCGIWRSVSLKSYEKAYINDVFVRSIFECKNIFDAKKVDLLISTDVDFINESSFELSCEVYGDERYDDVTKPIAAFSTQIRKCKDQSYITIENPNLWWPNGSGRPYLYKIVINLKDESGNIVDSKAFNHGIRTVGLFQMELGQGQKSFTFMINNTPIFAKGANWVPNDCIIGRITNEKYKALLEAAAEANMNMMRVWGGGFYESDYFMDQCDKLGIMVWHDFMFACAYYPDFDEEYYNNVKVEATAAIKRLRSHGSLIGWSGNNEIQEMYLSLKNNRKDAHEFYGEKFYRDLLPNLCKELVPDLIYRESSPYGGDEPAGFDEGDQHVWHFTHRPNFEHYLDIWRFTDFRYKFLSEFGIIGAMNLESAERCISKEGLRPDSEEWLHHTNTCKLLTRFVEKYFGPTENMSVQEFILKSQVIQAEIMRHIYDELRSRKFECSGVLLWTFNDSYGIHNWSVVDYYLGKRPIYYYLQRSLAPLAVSWKGYEAQTFGAFESYKEYYKGKLEPLTAYVTNDTLEDKQVLVKYTVMSMSGKVLKSREAARLVPANSVRKSVSLDLSDVIKLAFVDELFVLAELYCDGILQNENRYFLAPYKELALPKASVNCRYKKLSEDTVELEVTSDSFVWMLHLATPEGVNPRDNDFDVIPGKARKVVVSVPNADEYNPAFVSLNPGLNIKVEK